MSTHIGVSPSGKASDSDSDIPVFESQYPSQTYNKNIKFEKNIDKRRKHMIVDKEGKLFEDRRKKSEDRRKKQVEVKKDRRKSNRRTENNKRRS